MPRQNKLPCSFHSECSPLLSIKCFFLFAGFQGLRFLSIRFQRFHQVSLSMISGALTGSSAFLALGSMKVFYPIMTPGLIIGQNILYASRLCLLLFSQKMIPSLVKNLSVKTAYKVAWKYRCLALTLFGSQGMAEGYGRLPTFAISIMYSDTVLGFWGLAERALGAPVQLISRAIGDVFFQRASVDYRRNDNFVYIFKKTLASTALIGIPVYALGFFIAPGIFAFAFGEEWRVAGKYASILLVGGLFSFITTPLDRGAIIVGANRYILFWHALRLIGKLGVIAVTYMFGLGIEAMLWGIVGIRIFLYCLDLLMNYKFAKGLVSEKP